MVLEGELQFNFVNSDGLVAMLVNVLAPQGLGHYHIMKQGRP